VDATQARPAVLVSGPSEAAARRFLARYVKPAFGMRKPQWRVRYREAYPLAVLSRPLREGESARDAYGPYAGCGALVLACLGAAVPGSGRAAALAWLKASGFDPVVELVLPDAALEAERIDLGAEVVNFVNSRCPWRSDPVDDIDAYLAANNKPFWA